MFAMIKKHLEQFWTYGDALKRLVIKRAYEKIGSERLKNFWRVDEHAQKMIIELTLKDDIKS